LKYDKKRKNFKKNFKKIFVKFGMSNFAEDMKGLGFDEEVADMLWGLNDS